MQSLSRVRNALVSDHQPLLRKLQTVSALNEVELEALRRLPVIIREVPRGHDIAREGDRPLVCCIVIEGMAFRYKTFGGGRRQIMSFHAPGDIPDLQSLHLGVMDHHLAALSPVKAGMVQHADMRELCLRFPRVAAALWRETLIDSAISREWLAGVGRRDAATRIAHLLCELYTRLKVVGLAADRKARLPITQVELADALGLSDVHVNRSLAHMKTRKLLTLKGGFFTVLDWDGLAELGEFNPSYLHINPTAEPVAV